MIRVFSAPIPAQAHIVRGALEAAGIPAEVRGEARTPLAGGLPVDACFAEVWVGDDAAAAALELIAELAPGQSSGALSLADAPTGGELSPAGEWRCARCGETSPATFETCWQCQTPRDPGPGGPRRARGWGPRGPKR
jgi:hypothetical protein